MCGEAEQLKFDRGIPFNLGNSENKMRILWFYVASTLMAATNCEASATDINKAIDQLAPAFLAQSLTNVCAVRRPQFTWEVSGPEGDPNFYVAYVKREATLALSPLDAQIAIKNAALAARNTALQEIRSRKNANSERELAKIYEWCETTVKPFVKNFIQKYENKIE